MQPRARTVLQSAMAAVGRSG